MNDVEFIVHSGIGRITLNRPKALNALTHDMVVAITNHLDDWRDDPEIRAVLIDGAGGRGLCAGGDIRSIYDDMRTGGSGSLAFWADEYQMNATIARYPKPYLALMDGVVMGGGVGVSAHGSHRVVTERSRVGMPEVGIGFVPDVGGSYLLSRAPGQLGVHIALTATALSGADAIYCGLADCYVPSERLPDLLDVLASRTPDDALAVVAEPAPPSGLAAERSWIDHCYAADSVEEILVRLHDGGDAAVAAAKEIETKSPTALKVALRALRRAAARTSSSGMALLGCGTLEVERTERMPAFANSVVMSGGNSACVMTASMAVAPAAVSALAQVVRVPPEETISSTSNTGRPAIRAASAKLISTERSSRRIFCATLCANPSWPARSLTQGRDSASGPATIVAGSIPASRNALAIAGIADRFSAAMPGKTAFISGVRCRWASTVITRSTSRPKSIARMLASERASSPVPMSSITESAACTATRAIRILECRPPPSRLVLLSAVTRFGRNAVESGTSDASTPTPRPRPSASHATRASNG